MAVLIKDYPDGTVDQKRFKAELLRRATAVGRSGNVTEVQLHAAEAQYKTDVPEVTDVELAKRAKLVGLDDKASEEKVILAEKQKGLYVAPPLSLAERARAAGIKEDATEAQVIAAEDRQYPYPHSLENRAKLVGIDENSSEALVIQAEAERGVYRSSPSSDLIARAKLAGLPDTATEAEVHAKEVKALKETPSVRSLKIKDMPEDTLAQKDKKAALLKRAKAVGLDSSATEVEVKEEE